VQQQVATAKCCAIPFSKALEGLTPLSHSKNPSPGTDPTKEKTYRPPVLTEGKKRKSPGKPGLQVKEKQVS